MKPLVIGWEMFPRRPRKSQQSPFHPSSFFSGLSVSVLDWAGNDWTRYANKHRKGQHSTAISLHHVNQCLLFAWRVMFYILYGVMCFTTFKSPCPFIIIHAFRNLPYHLWHLTKLGRCQKSTISSI